MVQLLSAVIVGPTMFVNLSPAFVYNTTTITSVAINCLALVVVMIAITVLDLSPLLCLELYGRFVPEEYRKTINDTSKGGLTIFWELFPVIPCAPKHLKLQCDCYLKVFGSQIETERFSKTEEATL